MKTQFLYLVIFSLLVSCTQDPNDTISLDDVVLADDSTAVLSPAEANEAVPKDERILSVASGMLTFKYSGKWKGTETVWFDRYGLRVVLDQDIVFSGKTHQKNRFIWSGQQEGSYTCEYLNDHGEEEKRCYVPPLRVKDTELSHFSHGDAAQLHHAYEPIGQKTLFGKVASGWKSKTADISCWNWRGIDLSSNNQGIIREVQSIEELDEIPAHLLQLPEGFTLEK